MCGFAILVTKAAVSRFVLDDVAKALAHRGPDGAGIHTQMCGGWHYQAVATRLAVRGGADSAQPYHHAGSTLCYNGEVATPDLRPDTPWLAEQLSVETADTKRDMLAALDGMFALAWLDEGKLLLARDGWGIKPLFLYWLPEGGLLAGSEIGALLATGLIMADVDANQMASIRYRRRPAVGYSIYPQIVPLMPGSVVELDLASWDGKPRRGVVFHDAAGGFARHLLNAKKPTVRPLKDLAAELGMHLEAAASQALVSDGPVGLMLSGGADSGMLLAACARVGRVPECFTVGGTPEVVDARRWADHYGARLHEVECLLYSTAHLAWLRHQCHQPIADQAGYLTWQLAGAAKARGIKVLLSGAGADELMGGYRRTLVFSRYLQIRRAGLVGLWGLGILGRLVRTMWPGSMLAHGLRAQPAGPAQTYHAMMSLPGSLESIKQIPEDAPLVGPGEATPLEWLAWALAEEIRLYLTPQVLAVTDLASMGQGVEVRLPFLAKGVEEFLQGTTFRADATAANCLGKPILRELARLWQVEGLLARQKLGFGLHTDKGLAGMERHLGLDLPSHLRLPTRYAYWVTAGM